MALDLCGQLMCDPSVAKHYVFQDRADMEDESDKTDKEIQEVIDLFKVTKPKIALFDTDDDEAYGLTPMAKLPTIFLNSKLVVNAKATTRYPLALARYASTKYVNITVL